MDEMAVRGWFADYVLAFASLGRGESGPDDVMGYYDVPSTLTTDEAVVLLGTEGEVAAWLQSQADAMRAAGYAGTETLASEVTILNRHTAVCRADFSRRRADGTEINHMTVTYVITRRSDALRFNALVVHSP